MLVRGVVRENSASGQRRKRRLRYSANRNQPSTTSGSVMPASRRGSSREALDEGGLVIWRVPVGQKLALGTVDLVSGVTPADTTARSASTKGPPGPHPDSCRLAPRAHNRAGQPVARRTRDWGSPSWKDRYEPGRQESALDHRIYEVCVLKGGLGGEEGEVRVACDADVAVRAAHVIPL